MTNTVSFTDFRKNLSNYIELLAKGEEITVRDAKKAKNLITLISKKEKEFDWDAHLEWMKNFKPFWTKEDDKHLKKIRLATRKRFKELNW